MRENKGSPDLDNDDSPKISGNEEATLPPGTTTSQHIKTDPNSVRRSFPLRNISSCSNDAAMKQLAHDDSERYSSYTDLISAPRPSRFFKVPGCILDNRSSWLWISIAAVCVAVNWVTMVVVVRNLQEATKQSLVLRQLSSSQWLQPKFNAFLSLYQFTLSELSDNSTPSVHEIGPYVYRYIIERENVTWHENSSVSYLERRTAIFQESMSVGHRPKLIPLLVSLMNNTEAMMNVYTGETNFEHLNKVFSWNYQRKLPYWDNDRANQIRGTDGFSFNSFLNEKSELSLFYPSLLRSFDLEYVGTRTFKELPVYRYIIPDSQFSNSTPLTGAKRSADSGSSTSLPSGLYNFSPDLDFDLWYLSLPHFLGADLVYRDLVRGLQPDESKHRPTFDIDQITGVTVRQNRRFQINMRQELDPTVVAYVPVYWIDLSIEVNDDTLKEVKRRHLPFKLTYGICISAGLVLSICLVVLLMVLVCQIMRNTKRPSKYFLLTFQSGNHCC